MTEHFFGMAMKKRSECEFFGVKNLKAKQKEIGFSVDQLKNVKDERNVTKLQILTANDEVHLKDYVVLLCAHLNTIIMTTELINKAAKTNTSYSTMLFEIEKAYGDSSNNTPLLNEIYFYICFCTKGTNTFYDNDIINLYIKIAKKDRKTARKICDNLSDFFDYRHQEGVSVLSSVHDFLRGMGSKNYFACVFQIFLDLNIYNISVYDSKYRSEYLNCEGFLELFERINTVFPIGELEHDLDSHDLDPEQLLIKMNSVLNS